jgi:hypothetical protein
MKILPGTNTLAYSFQPLATKKKKVLKSLTPVEIQIGTNKKWVPCSVGRCKKLFYAVMDGLACEARPF